MTGYILWTKELFSANPVKVAFFTPAIRKQHKRASDAVDAMQAVGLYAWLTTETIS